MVMEKEFVGGTSKLAGSFLSPLAKINLIITAIFFICLAFVGVFESIEQNSLYPLVSRTLIPLVGADAQISQSIDILESSDRPHFLGFFNKSFPSWLFFWLKFWILTVINIWFIYFFIWLIYTCWALTNDSVVIQNWIATFITFIIISMFVGMIMYNMSLAGKCLSSDKVSNFNTQIKNVYPFHGIIKLITHTFNKDLFYSVADFSQTDMGGVISGIPEETISEEEVNI